MISYSQTPWNDKGISKWRNILVSVVFLISIMLGYLAVFSSGQAHAQTEPFSECSSVLVVGDTHAKGIQRAGIEERLKEQGARDVEFMADDRLKVSGARNFLEGRDLKDTCIILEAGSGNIPVDKDTNSRVINEMISTLRPAKQVYWVKPLISDGGNPNSQYKSTDFNDLLEDKLKNSRNIELIDIGELSSRTDLFRENNVLGMTDEGYRERIGSIFNDINEHLRENQEESSSPSPSPSPSPSNPPGDNGGGGQQPPGTGPGQGPGAPQDTNPGPGDDHGICDAEGVCNKDSLSPLAFAMRAKEMASPNEAGRYLTIGRWGSPAVPTKILAVEDPSSFTTTAMSSFAQGGIATAHGLSSMGFMALNFAFTTNIADLGIKLGDSIYGYVFGISGGNSAARVSAIISSILMIAIIMSIMRLFTGVGQSMRSKATGILISIAKVSIAISLLVVSASQSAKNSGGAPAGYQQYLKDEFNTYMNQFEGQNAGGPPINYSHAGEISNDQLYENLSTYGLGSGVMVGERGTVGGDTNYENTISEPRSWEPLSLGWAISQIYVIGNYLGGAIVSIFSVVVNSPIETAKEWFNQANFDRNSSDGVMAACDRYVDSMHQTFDATTAMRNNKAASTVLRTYDMTFYTYFYSPYAKIYGGNTLSASNSWCWNSEVSSGLPVGEWMMLSRGAGLYFNAIGKGNLIGDANQYANGRHNTANVALNLSPMPGSSAGAIVNANGTWNDSYKDPVSAAEMFMGVGTGSDGYNQAKYYFAACFFDPNEAEPYLVQEWRDVRGMGTSGKTDNASSDTDFGDANGATFFMYLKNEDCGISDRHTAEGEEADKKRIIPKQVEDKITGGFGNPENEAVKRWAFAPKTSDGALDSLVDGVTSQITTAWHNRSAFFGGEGGNLQEGESDDDPLFKFKDNDIFYGERRAQEFWYNTNGENASFGTVIIASVVSLCALFFFCIILPMLIIAIIINFVISVMLAMIALVMSVVVIVYAFRGGMNKK